MIAAHSPGIPHWHKQHISPSFWCNCCTDELFQISRKVVVALFHQRNNGEWSPGCIYHQCDYVSWVRSNEHGLVMLPKATPGATKPTK